MDRDRIVEDVEDIDDYFDYERPLDFVSAAERREILKNAEGNEDVANAMLLEKETGKASEQSESAEDGVVNGATGSMECDDEETEVTAGENDEMEEDETPVTEPTSNAEKKVTKPTPSSSDDDLDDEDMDLLDMD